MELYVKSSEVQKILDDKLKGLENYINSYNDEKLKEVFNMFYCHTLSLKSELCLLGLITKEKSND